MVLFECNNKVQEIRYWSNSLQQIVNKAAFNQHLQFTAETWNNDKSIIPYENKYRVRIIAAIGVIFLDMDIIWSLKGGCN